MSMTLKPEIGEGDYVRLGKGKEVWKVKSRLPTQATIREIWLGTTRYSINVERLTKVTKEGKPL